jgi:hypothetical protein
VIPVQQAQQLLEQLARVQVVRRQVLPEPHPSKYLAQLQVLELVVFHP